MKTTLIMRATVFCIGAAGCVANTAVDPVPRDSKWIERHKSFITHDHGAAIDVVFLGDSITDGWRKEGRVLWDEHFAPLRAANFGIDGDRTQHLLWRLDHGALDGLSPKVAVVLIGTNNVGLEKDRSRRNSKDEAIAGVTKVVRTLRSKVPTSRLLLLGILPRGETNSAERTDVAEINRALSKLADENVRFLDIGSRFLCADGSISREIMPDLLHPNEAGYEIWAAAIKPALLELLKDSHDRR